jgi:hypothetical protein
MKRPHSACVDSLDGGRNDSNVFRQHSSRVSYHSSITGVSDIQTNVDAKSVVVLHDESVSKEVMLEKLQKWSAASGKSVALSS